MMLPTKNSCATASMADPQGLTPSAFPPPIPGARSFFDSTTEKLRCATSVSVLGSEIDTFPFLGKSRSALTVNETTIASRVKIVASCTGTTSPRFCTVIWASIAPGGRGLAVRASLIQRRVPDTFLRIGTLSNRSTTSSSHASSTRRCSVAEPASFASNLTRLRNTPRDLATAAEPEGSDNLLLPAPPRHAVNATINACAEITHVARRRFDAIYHMPFRA